MRKMKSEFPLLIAQAGPLNGQQWFVKEELLIGRDDSCDIVIDDRQVSRRHAQVSIEKEKILLNDLGSKNGTYKNGLLVDHSVHVRDGDIVKIALVQDFLLISSDATVPLDKITRIDMERLGRLFIDAKARRIWIGEKEIKPPLSVCQFRLLQILYEHQGEVVSREQIVQTIWGDTYGDGVTEQSIDALVRRLRNRLKKGDSQTEYIKTVRGFGFRLENPPYRKKD
ncbi:MAG TPA: FHA domain-containing protein [Anaerolineae bacterium]|nr:FHA domain-containing protein [Anaerolineae bacterium]